MLHRDDPPRYHLQRRPWLFGWLRLLWYPTFCGHFPFSRVSGRRSSHSQVRFIFFLIVSGGRRGVKVDHLVHWLTLHFHAGHVSRYNLGLVVPEHGLPSVFS